MVLHCCPDVVPLSAPQNRRASSGWFGRCCSSTENLQLNLGLTTAKRRRAGRAGKDQREKAVERGCEQTLPRRSRHGDAEFLELRAGVAFCFASRKTPHYVATVPDTRRSLSESEQSH